MRRGINKALIGPVLNAKAMLPTAHEFIIGEAGVKQDILATFNWPLPSLLLMLASQNSHCLLPNG